MADSRTLVAVCGAAKKLAANEEICKAMAEEGAVAIAMKVCSSCLAYHHESPCWASSD